jgi:hypothetical protein
MVYTVSNNINYEKCYVDNEEMPMRRYYAHSDNTLTFYAYDGEFFSSDKFTSTNTYSYLKQAYGGKFLKNKISHASFVFKSNSNKSISYVPERTDYMFTLGLLNHIIEYVDEALEDNELYQINKFKRLTGIEVGYSPKNPSRVMVYSPQLMSYYDGLNWNKIPPQLLI